MNYSPRNLLSGLYAVTDASVTDPDKMFQNVEQALLGGARCIQFRDKSDNHEQRLQTSIDLRELTRRLNALFFINDDVDLAKEVSADGVHLGQDDTDLGKAREQLGQHSLIGISCYNRYELAEEAAKQGADYVAFGSFFSSSTKPNAVKADIQLLHRAKQQLGIPVVAIGGITVDNGLSLIEAGADMLAVVDGIFGQTDITAATRQFCSLFQK